MIKFNVMENVGYRSIEAKRERYYYYIACAVEHLKYAITDIVEFGKTLESLNSYYDELKKIDFELLNFKND